jgi:hypothetical protein
MDRRRPPLALACLLLLTLACGAPAQSPHPSATEPAPTASPTPAEPPPPFSLSEGVTSGVEDGTWTRAEGLIHMLRYIAGELTTEEVFGDQAPSSSEGTGVVRQAFDYLDDPANIEGRDEIERLLDVLVPTRETLDRFSRPAVASRSAPGVARAAARPVGDETDCRALWAEGFADAGPIICLEYDEFSVGGNTYRVYYPAYWPAGDARRELLQPTTDAMRAALEEFTRYGPASVIPADLVFTDLAYLEDDGRRTDNVLAVASPRERRSRCHVAVFPSGVSEPESLPFILAHEIFHCYQYTNLSPQESGPPPDVNEWWVEGSANYFATVVLPASNYEWGYATEWFDPRSVRRSIFRMNYDNYLFFEYLEMSGGLDPAGIVELLRRMPVGGSWAEQQIALAGVEGMEEAYHAFGQTYLDRELLDSGGGSVPVSPRPGETFRFVRGSVDEEFSAEPFQLARFRLSFEEDTRFDTFTELASGEGTISARPAPSTGAWGDLPFDLNTVCGESEYIALVTGASASSSGPRFSVHVFGAEPEEETECDRCLIGVWQLDLNSYVTGYESLASSFPGPAADIQDIVGAVEMEFTEAGTVSSRIDGLKITATIDMGVPAEMTVLMNGVSSAIYVVRPLGTLTTAEQVEGIVVDVSVVIGGRSASAPISGPPAPGPISGTYTCSGDSLHFTPLDVGVPHPGLDYTRVP